MFNKDKDTNRKKMDQYIYDAERRTDDEDGDASAGANPEIPDEEGEFFTLE
jgi:hypothetical protein